MVMVVLNIHPPNIESAFTMLAKSQVVRWALIVGLSLTSSLVISGCGDAEQTAPVQTDAMKAQAASAAEATAKAFKEAQKHKAQRTPRQGGFSNGVRTS